MLEYISHYKIISKIASGGMANVYLALDTKTNTKVAIKVLIEEVSDKEKILERFKQEGLLNLNHPNIVKILDAGVHDNTPYIVMEYIEGRDLEDLIKSRNKLTINEALSIFTQLLSALSYVHSKGIMHRDIKPKNILIDKSGKVKLTDFGIAKSLYSHVKTSTGAYIGAPAYSSPEQMDSKPVDSRSDIYSLGVTFYQMLAGNTPSGSSSIEEIIKTKFIGRPTPITNYRSDIPGHIISIINKCIARDPNDRFGSVDEIITALSKYENNKTIIKDTTPNLTDSNKKYGLMFSIAAVIMLAVIITLAVNLTNKNAKLSKAAIKTSIPVSETRTETNTAAVETTALAATAKSKIVFNSDRDGNYEIYIMNVDGSGQVRLTNNTANDWYPSFSPDGSKITFSSDRNGNNEIYIMNVDGSEQVRLTNNITNDWYPSFSPDGSKIAFMSSRDGNSEIYIMNTDGSEQVNLTNNPANDGVPSFSPDGSKIAFNSGRDGNNEIYTMNTDGSGVVRLTNEPDVDAYPSFSPNGLKIAFNSDRDGNNEIYTMNTDGSGVVRLTNEPAVDAYPSFSPDGSKIAFVSDRDGSDQIFEIYIMNIDGSEQVNLTNNPANDWFPSFSPI